MGEQEIEVIKSQLNELEKEDLEEIYTYTRDLIDAIELEEENEQE